MFQQVSPVVSSSAKRISGSAMSKSIILCAAAAGLLLLASAYWAVRRPLPESVAPETLVSCCGIIRHMSEQAGMGFFVRTVGDATNTFFITAAHTLTKIRERENRGDFDLRVAVRRREAARSIEITLPCNAVTVALLPVDLAAVQVEDSLLRRRELDVSPLVLRVPSADKERKGSEARVVGEAEPQGSFVTADQLRSKMETARHQLQEKPSRGIKICSGEPGFLLHHSRTACSVKLGHDIFTLTSQSCREEALATDLFPVFYRTGVVSFIKEDPAGYEPAAWSTTKPNFLVIDCRASKGNSGAPVFLPVKETFRGGYVCETPHLLGVLVAAVSAKGEAQRFDLPLMSGGKETARLQGEQVFDENAGLSIVVPVDYLAAWLLERARQR